jgi:hypothetical protein
VWLTGLSVSRMIVQCVRYSVHRGRDGGSQSTSSIVEESATSSDSSSGSTSLSSSSSSSIDKPSLINLQCKTVLGWESGMLETSREKKWCD